MPGSWPTALILVLLGKMQRMITKSSLERYPIPCFFLKKSMSSIFSAVFSRMADTLDVAIVMLC
jgi:hypothetical protein